MSAISFHFAIKHNEYSGRIVLIFLQFPSNLMGMIERDF